MEREQTDNSWGEGGVGVQEENGQRSYTYGQGQWGGGARAWGGDQVEGIFVEGERGTSVII